MTPEQIQTVLADHVAWRANPDMGKRADLTSANLSWANLSWANLTGANLSWANLTGINLTGAILTRTNLTGANLIDANLPGADLYCADLTNAAGVIDAGDRDGWQMVGVQHDAGIMIKAGCRWFSVPQARRHWSESNMPDRSEHAKIMLDGVDLIEREARRLRWPCV